MSALLGIIIGIIFFVIICVIICVAVASHRNQRQYGYYGGYHGYGRSPYYGSGVGMVHPGYVISTPNYATSPAVIINTHRTTII
uniref:Uncharacterized protein n=1 Tax=Panagrolaimus superbus TaxID=310955 RepID=A0A914ZES1_9BILA